MSERLTKEKNIGDVVLPQTKKQRKEERTEVTNFGVDALLLEVVAQIKESLEESVNEEKLGLKESLEELGESKREPKIEWKKEKDGEKRSAQIAPRRIFDIIILGGLKRK